MLVSSPVSRTRTLSKGTLFRAFGSRDGLLNAPSDAKFAPVREAVQGPAAPTRPDKTWLYEPLLSRSAGFRPVMAPLFLARPDAPAQTARAGRATGDFNATDRTVPCPHGCVGFVWHCTAEAGIGACQLPGSDRQWRCARRSVGRFTGCAGRRS
ncbi:hypothetical protein GCM10022222_33880 [Amycolatopsis ultiminotia]|uniref:Uncharacterized protein n=1 Tax=Amycolatopsis ultiminotia TaxID=543629 RepID=A0ABP6WCS9_9PSEU